VPLGCWTQERGELQQFGARLQEQSHALARAKQQLAALQEQLERQQAQQHEAAAALQAQGAQLAQQQRAAAELRRGLDRERVLLAEERGALVAERTAAGRAADRARDAQQQLSEAVRALAQQGVPVRLSFEGQAGDVPVITLLEGGAGSGAGAYRARDRGSPGSGGGGGAGGGALAQVLQRAGLAPEQMQRLGRERSEYLQQQQLLLARLKSGGCAGPGPALGVPVAAFAPPLGQPQAQQWFAAAAAAPEPAAATASPPAPARAQQHQRQQTHAPDEVELLACTSFTSLVPLSTSASEADLDLQLAGGRQQAQGRAAGRQQAVVGAAAPLGATARGTQMGARQQGGGGAVRASLDGGSSLATVTESCLEGLTATSGSEC
jgi:hypothetical protein